MEHTDISSFCKWKVRARLLCAREGPEGPCTQATPSSSEGAVCTPFSQMKQSNLREARDGRGWSPTARGPESWFLPRYSVLKVSVLRTPPQLCHVLSVAGISSMWKALKRFQSHFEISWQKIECRPKRSLGFKHFCQSWLSSPGDFYPNNRSLWCAGPEGPWAAIMSEIGIYWAMQINKKETGSLKLFHDCLLCCQAHGLLQAKHLPFYYFNNLCNGNERARLFHSADILITAMIGVIFEHVCDRNGSSKLKTQRRSADRLWKCHRPS